MIILVTRLYLLDRYLFENTKCLFTCIVSPICFNLADSEHNFIPNKSHSWLRSPSHDAFSLLFHQESSFTVGPGLLEGGGGDRVGEDTAHTGGREVALRGGEEEEAFSRAGLHLKLT